MRSRSLRLPSRTLVALVLGAVTLGSIPTVAAQQDSGAPAPGRQGPPTQGQAVAGIASIDPAIASLALTISVGTSIAGHQNSGSGSQADSLDLGIIGDLLTAEACDGGDPTVSRDSLPAGLLIDSNDPTSAEGVEGGIDELIDLYAEANNSPTSRASATLLPIGIPGVIEIEGGSTTSVSDGTTATATAVAEIGAISLLDGAVRLKGLRWEATRSLGTPPTMATDFTIGAIELAGNAVALPDGIDAIADLLEPVLSIVGVRLAMPEPFEIPDGIGLSPLSVGIVPSDLRDSVVGGLLGALGPTKSSLEEELLALDCGNATYLTVLDVVLGSISGGGSFTVELGGVQASVREVSLTSFLGGAPTPGGPTGPSLPPTPGTRGSGVSAPSGGLAVPAPTTSPTPSVDTGDTETAAAVVDVPEPLEGERGGPLLYVGAVGLAGVGLAGIAERFKMRKGQRSGPMPTS